MSFVYNNLNPAQILHIANGCGPKNKILGKISNFLMPEAFNMACVKHDIGYWIGNTEEDRLASDEEFCDEIWYISSQQSWWKRWWYYATAWAACKLVKQYGDELSFYYGPRKRTLEDLNDEMEITSDSSVNT